MAAASEGLPRNIGAPATRALTAAGYTELRQLANVPVAELKKLHGVGPKACGSCRKPSSSRACPSASANTRPARPRRRLLRYGRVLWCGSDPWCT
jgi:hypothetical protein